MLRIFFKTCALIVNLLDSFVGICLLKLGQFISSPGLLQNEVFLERIEKSNFQKGNKRINLKLCFYFFLRAFAFYFKLKRTIKIVFSDLPSRSRLIKPASPLLQAFSKLHCLVPFFAEPEQELVQRSTEEGIKLYLISTSNHLSKEHREECNILKPRKETSDCVPLSFYRVADRKRLKLDGYIGQSYKDKNRENINPNIRVDYEKLHTIRGNSKTNISSGSLALIYISFESQSPHYKSHRSKFFKKLASGQSRRFTKCVYIQLKRNNAAKLLKVLKSRFVSVPEAVVIADGYACNLVQSILPKLNFPSVKVIYISPILALSQSDYFLGSIRARNYKYFISITKGEDEYEAALEFKVLLNLYRIPCEFDVYDCKLYMLPLFYKFTAESLVCFKKIESFVKGR